MGKTYGSKIAQNYNYRNQFKQTVWKRKSAENRYMHSHKCEEQRTCSLSSADLKKLTLSDICIGKDFSNPRSYVIHTASNLLPTSCLLAKRLK
ncbi:hypothetical protein CEXT_399911 [Caerostris extrusa]|uniref:Uncharacterized protein n=1 Tax=Caerostris extrusa TaxID=172846 RepID=A0AAV4UUQ2_CAEEX|nr:hypothetical protein CEXT_399911 [Caerostris extrusa]